MNAGGAVLPNAGGAVLPNAGGAATHDGGRAATLDAGRVVPPVDRGEKSPAKIEPLAPGRYRVQFTASATLRQKLERLQELMRTSLRDADLAAVIEAAVTDKLERLEARRFAFAARARRTVQGSDARPRTRHVPAAIRRAVWSRDEGRCRFVDETGRRCAARGGLEYHHRHPFGFGGGHSLDNICLMCRTHNRYLAEVDYGARSVRNGPSRGTEAAAGGVVLTDSAPAASRLEPSGAHSARTESPAAATDGVLRGTA